MSDRPTLLIVDDEPFNLDILQEHLEDNDFNVIRAEDGPMALDILENASEDISTILLDKMMPGMDGFEVLRKITSSDKFKHIPVIMQTAAASDKDISDGIDAGAFYYLTKPFEPELMLSIVKAALNDFENLRQTRIAKDEAGSLGPEENILHLKLQFQTISEAQHVAGRVSAYFPDPDKVLLGLTEIVINAIEHGNLGITYEEKSELLNNNSWAQEIERRLSLDEYKDRIATIEFVRREKDIILSVIDQGEGFDWKSFISMTSERAYDSHGRGIAMASMVSFDRMEYIGNGNHVNCFVNLEPDEDDD